MNLQGLSNADLKALSQNNLQGVSNAGLKYLQSQQPVSQTAAPSHSMLGSLGRHALADVADFGHDILNAPHNIISEIPAYEPNFNYHNALGVKKNLADKVAVGAMDYAPYALGGEAVAWAKGLGDLAGQAIGGSLFGATHNPGHVARGALMGGALGAAGYGAAKLAGNAVKPVARYVLNNAVKPLVERAGQAIEKQDLPTAQQGANHLLNNYQDLKSVAGQLFNKAGDQAQTIAQPFDNSKYVDALQGHLSGLKKVASRGKASANNVQNAIDQTQDWIDNAPQTFEDAVYHRKDINAAPNVYLNPQNQADKSVKAASDVARKALDNQLDSNVTKTPGAQDFANTWGDANKYWKQAMDFEKLPTKLGAMKKSNTIGQALQSNNPDASVINQYLPSGKEDGLNKMQHFADLIGDQDQAKRYLKSALVNQNVTKDGVNTNGFLNQYKKLSPQQRNYLFNDDENAMLGAAVRAKNAGTKHSHFSSLIGHYIIPAVAGGEIAHKEGLPWEYGAVGGALGGKGISELVGRMAASPKIIPMVEHLSESNLGANAKGTVPAAIAQNLLNEGTN